MNQPTIEALPHYALALRTIMRERLTTRSRAERIQYDAMQELLMPMMLADMADAIHKLSTGAK
jgi:hypothetical protein